LKSYSFSSLLEIICTLNGNESDGTGSCKKK